MSKCQLIRLIDLELSAASPAIKCRARRPEKAVPYKLDQWSRKVFAIVVVVLLLVVVVVVKLIEYLKSI